VSLAAFGRTNYRVSHGSLATHRACPCPQCSQSRMALSSRRCSTTRPLASRTCPFLTFLACAKRVLESSQICHNICDSSWCVASPADYVQRTDSNAGGGDLFFFCSCPIHSSHQSCKVVIVAIHKSILSWVTLLVARCRGQFLYPLKFNVQNSSFVAWLSYWGSESTMQRGNTSAVCGERLPNTPRLLNSHQSQIEFFTRRGFRSLKFFNGHERRSQPSHMSFIASATTSMTRKRKLIEL
jgi:hypothetical protein